MSKKGHSGGGLNFLAIFRYFVGFAERFFLNLFKNLSWLFSNSQLANNHFDRLYLRHLPNDYLIATKILLVILLLLILGKFIVFALLLWTIAKSI